MNLLDAGHAVKSIIYDSSLMSKMIMNIDFNYKLLLHFVIEVENPIFEFRKQGLEEGSL